MERDIVESLGSGVRNPSKVSGQDCPGQVERGVERVVGGGPQKRRAILFFGERNGSPRQ